MAKRFKTQEEYENWKSSKLKNINQNKKIWILPVAFLIIIIGFFIVLSVINYQQKSKEIAFRKKWDTIDREIKRIEEESKRQPWKPSENDQYYLDELIKHSGGVLSNGFWAQKESVYIHLDPTIAKDKYQADELAHYCSRYLSKALNRFICVHLYIGNLRRVSRACSSP